MSIIRMARRIACTLLLVSHAAAAQDPAAVALADRVFAQYSAAAPGCQVGVSRDGSVLVEKAYGAADLERGAPLSAASIIEAGSVSKQFTAAAVTLLALEGKLRFDDPVQKHFPELPQYERAITIRMLLDHTSGLRDWGDIASLAGAPRGTRAYTHAHVLEIIARQRAVNYPPGDQYSYTNSGYNLLAMLVARVSGQSFADFTRDRLFRPLGMTSTSWRDDYRRIVPGRALAYAPVPGVLASWRTDMPNEDAHGNGGLLTTVGDLLRWNDALAKRTVGGAHGAALVDSLTRRGVLSSGERIPYAAGLVVDEYRGTPRVAHSGATAGYRAYLARFPAQQELSVAVLCNTFANATALALGMVDGLATGLAPVVRPAATPPAPRGAPLPADSVRRFVGEYVSDEVGASLRVTLEGERLMVRRGAEAPALATQMGEGRFSVGGTTIWFTPDGASGGPVLHVATGRAHDVVFRRAR